MKNDFEIVIKEKSSDKLLARYYQITKSFATSWGNHDPAEMIWFRGQSSSKFTLKPGVYRKPENSDNKKKKDYDEFWLFRRFRDLASNFDNIPDYDKTDQWLFLMQHSKLPTRLLDWTESALVALYFSIKDYLKFPGEYPAIYMLQPFFLNYYITGEHSLFPSGGPIASCYFEMVEKQFMQFKNISITNPKNIKNYRKEAIELLFRKNKIDMSTKKDFLVLPIAVQSTYCHQRMRAQRSAFTIHGFEMEGFEKIPADLIELPMDADGNKKRFLQRIVLECTGTMCKEMLDDLRRLGITESTIFPDFEGLAYDLKEYLLTDMDKPFQ